MHRASLVLSIIFVVVGFVMADVEQGGISQLSSYSETFFFPVSPANGLFLNTTDSTNRWLLSFTDLKRISIILNVQQTGNTNTLCVVEGVLVDLSTGHNYEFQGIASNIPFTSLRSVPDVKWVNIQNILVPITSGNLNFNLTIKYAEFWTNVQAELANDKIEAQLQGTTCTKEEFTMNQGGYLQSKPFWIVLQLSTGQQLTFPMPWGYTCRYNRAMSLVRTAC